MQVNQRQSRSVHHIIFLLIATLRPIRLLQIGEKDPMVKAARCFVAVIPGTEASLVALGFSKPMSAVLFVFAIMLVRFVTSLGVRFTVLLRTQSPKETSHTAADLIMAERAAAGALVPPCVAVLTVAILTVGLLRTGLPFNATQACVVFLILTEFANRILDTDQERNGTVIGFCVTQAIYCSPLLWVRLAQR